MSDMKIDETKILTIPLSDIYVDPTWNVRSGVGEGGEGGEDENSDIGLVESIKARGQDEPVLVRPTPKEAKVKQPYTLVYGFRRFWAISSIAEETGSKTPTIKAKVKSMTEGEARAANVRENTARDTLSAADICFGIGEIRKVNPNVVQTAVAQDLGLSQGYVGRHFAILDGLKPSLLQKWRLNRGIKITVKAIEAIAKLEKSAQDEAFAALVKAATPAGEMTDGEKANKFREAAKKRAATMGKLFGQLAREGHLTLDPETFFYDALEFYAPVKAGRSDKEVSDRVKNAVAQEGYKAFMSEFEKDDDTSGETAEDVKAKKKAKNSAEVSAN